MANTCPICGKPTYMVYGKYPRKDGLCSECGKRLNNHEIEQCPDCGAWKETGKTCKCKAKKVEVEKKVLSESICIICGKPSNGKDICKSCYAEVINCQNDLDKNKKKWELKDYYYNLKAFIGRLKNYQEAIANLYKLYAIAWSLKKLYNDDQLIDVVNGDIKFLLTQIERIKKINPNEQQQQHDKTLIAVADIEKNRASDGHICKSEGEVIIDDILFNWKVCHAYERRVKEITERAVIADWFIPTDGPDGIYIEYWGMTTKDYQDNKEEKLKLYEKYKDKVKLIQINKNDIHDRQLLADKIYQELVSFGWKK